MRDRVLAALLTAFVFAIGFGAGMWAERHRPFPPPPGAFMGEFGARRGWAAHASAPPVNRAQLIEQIDAIRPQMDAFRARVSEIYAEFDRDIATVLTAEQREQYEHRFRSQRGLLGPAEAPTSGKPLSDEQIEQLLQRPFRTLAFVVLPMTLDRMTGELKLDEAQRGKVNDFLHVRREKFIELVDNSPPLSLMLSRLAPIAQRLAGPGKPAGGATH
jgi:hypothetical protein